MSLPTQDVINAALLYFSFLHVFFFISVCTKLQAIGILNFDRNVKKINVYNEPNGNVAVNILKNLNDIKFTGVDFSKM